MIRCRRMFTHLFAENGSVATTTAQALIDTIGATDFVYDIDAVHSAIRGQYCPYLSLNGPIKGREWVI